MFNSQQTKAKGNWKLVGLYHSCIVLLLDTARLSHHVRLSVGWVDIAVLGASIWYSS